MLCEKGNAHFFSTVTQKNEGAWTEEDVPSPLRLLKRNRDEYADHFRASMERLQIKQIGIGQLHWSTANYAPLQEQALWDGLVAMYEKVIMIHSKP